MNTLYAEAEEFARKMVTLSPEDQAKVRELVETGHVPASDKADFAVYQAGVKRCAHCYKVLRPLARGSKRVYCSDACKMRAYRGRKAGEALRA